MGTQGKSSHREESPSSAQWSDAELEDFLWGAKVLTLVGTYGLRKAATDAFLAEGYRLATISRDQEPFEGLFKLSLYAIGDHQKLGRCEANKMVRAVMEKIGCRLGLNDCHTDVAGRRLVASVMLRHWTRLD